MKSTRDPLTALMHLGTCAIIGGGLWLAYRSVHFVLLNLHPGK